MAGPAYAHDLAALSYASNEPPVPVDPSLDRLYDEQHPLADLPAENNTRPDFEHGQAHGHEHQHEHQHQQHEHEHEHEHEQNQYPSLDAPANPVSDRDGFRPREDPRPIIPPDLDTSRVDLTYRRNPRSHSANNPGPDGWLYPHKKGIGTGSNLEAFKDEIEARTMRGENCKAIATALQGMGVQTSDKAISRVRIKWGMRKRSQRKIKTPPPDSDAARLTAKTKVQTLRKIEIKRMTEEGMTAEQIYENLTSRGMELKKGVATVLRLQSAWKLTENPKRWLENFRHQCHKKAKVQQIQAFKDIAKELVIEDLDAWLDTKLAEQQAREARHELAIQMMGPHAPTINRRKLQARRGEGQAANDASEGEEEDWQEALSTVEHEDNTNENASPYAGLNQEAGSAYAPMETSADDNMMDVDEGQGQGQESAESMAMRFAAGAATIASSKPDDTTAMDPSMSNPQPVATPDSKRGKGRPSKAKRATAKSASKAVAAPVHEAPTADMTPSAPGPSQDMQDPTPSHHQLDMQHSAYGPMASAASPAPGLVLRPEEAEANRSTLSTLDQYKAAAEAYQEVLQARTDNKPMAGSLTGLPPSSREVEAAKRKLKEVTQAMMLNLE